MDCWLGDWLTFCVHAFVCTQSASCCSTWRWCGGSCSKEVVLERTAPWVSQQHCATLYIAATERISAASPASIHAVLCPVDVQVWELLLWLKARTTPQQFSRLITLTILSAVGSVVGAVVLLTLTGGFSFVCIGLCLGGQVCCC